MASSDVEKLIKDYKNSDPKRKKLLEKKHGKRQIQLIENRLTAEYLKVCKTKLDDQIKLPIRSTEELLVIEYLTLFIGEREELSKLQVFHQQGRWL